MRNVVFQQTDLEADKSFSLSPLAPFLSPSLYLHQARLDLKIKPPELRRPKLKVEKERYGGGKLKWRW